MAELFEVAVGAGTMRSASGSAVSFPAGDFDTGTWTSTGIRYRVDVSSAATGDEIARLLAVVDEVAEIPRAIRAGAVVERVA